MMRFRRYCISNNKYYLHIFSLCLLLLSFPLSSCLPFEEGEKKNIECKPLPWCLSEDCSCRRRDGTTTTATTPPPTTTTIVAVPPTAADFFEKSSYYFSYPRLNSNKRLVGDFTSRFLRRMIHTTRGGGSGGKRKPTTTTTTTTTARSSVWKTKAQQRQQNNNNNNNKSNLILQQQQKQQQQQLRRRRRQQNLTLLLVATALFNDTLQLTMVLPIIHTLVTSPPPLGVTSSNTEVALGIFFASKDICQMIVAPIAGYITYMYASPNIALMVSTILLGIATFGFANATTYWQLLLSRASQGAASAAILCGGMSLVSQTFPSETRGSAIGLAQTGLALGILCGPLIGGLLFDKFGRVQTFRFAAIMVLANALAQLILMIVAPPEQRQHKKKALSQVAMTTDKKEQMNKMKELSSSSSSEEEESSNNNNNNKSMIRNRDVLAVLASTFAVHAVVGVVKPLSQVILDREFGIGMVGRSFVVTIATVTYFLTSPLCGWLSDKMSSRSRLVAMSLAIMTLSTIFFAIRGVGGGGLWAFNISIGLLGVSMGMAGSAGQALLADLVDRHQLGEYSMVFALSDMADSLGLIFGPVLGLYLSQVFGPSAGPGTMGLLCLFLIPVILRIP